MTLAACRASPYFAAGADLHTTAGVAQLWDNARILDMASVAPRELFQAHAEHRHEFVNENPLTQWLRGGFDYRTGLTTLVVYLDTVDMGVGVSPRLRVFVNETLRIDAAISAGVQAYTTTSMATWDLSDGQACDVRMELFDPSGGTPDLTGGRRWGTHYIVDAFVGPCSAVNVGTWPGIPTFSTGPDPARMQQLGDCADWLARRMGVVPMPLFQRVVSSPDSRWWTAEAGEQPLHIWSGGGPRGPFDRLALRLVWAAGFAQSTRLPIRINGTEVATTPTIGVGTWGQQTFSITLGGYAPATLLRVDLRQTDTVGNPADNGRNGYPMRWTLEYAELQRSAPPLQTMTFRPVPDELTSWATRRTRLQNIADWLNVIKTRIDTDVDRWDRIRLFRSSYAYKDAQYRIGRFHTVRRQRAGKRLKVRGSNLTIGWGPPTFQLVNPKEPYGEFQWSWSLSETLVGGNDVQTRVIDLDTLKGLEYGMPYTVYGHDVRYAAEILL
jgi:hypothetical protein